MVNKQLMYIIAPWMDVATSVSSSTAFLIKRAAERMGYFVKEFYGIWDWNLIFTTLLPLHDPAIIVYTGHGFPDKWMGDDPIFGTLMENQAYLLKDRAVIAVPSCYTAKSLGKVAVKEGARFYVGSKDLVWVAWNEPDHEYRRDFEFTWFTLVSTILDGKTPKVALDAYKNLCNKLIEYYKKKDLLNGDYYSDLLAHNRDGMVVLGNENDILPPPISFQTPAIEKVYDEVSPSRY